MSNNTDTLRWLMATRPQVCRWCRRRIIQGPVRDRTAATVDHLLPRERGGHTHRDDGHYNVALSCRGCNENRAAAGHCIAALRCYEAVKGSKSGQGAVTRWFAGTRPKSAPLTADTRRPMVISVGDDWPTYEAFWGDVLRGIAERVRAREERRCP